MPAYVLSEVEIVDEDAAARYRALAAASIEAHGGRYLARGVDAHVVEGAATARRLVLCEFPSLERIRVWYTSPEYAEALRFRAAALDRRLIFFEDAAPAPPAPGRQAQADSTSGPMPVAATDVTRPREEAP